MIDELNELNSNITDVSLLINDNHKNILLENYFLVKKCDFIYILNIFSKHREERGRKYTMYYELDLFNNNRTTIGYYLINENEYWIKQKYLDYVSISSIKN